MKPRFFVSKSYLTAGAVIDHMWVFTSTESTFVYTQKDGSVRIVESLYALTHMPVTGTEEVKFSVFKKYCETHDDYVTHFSYLLEKKKKTKGTVFGIKPFKGTVTINKSIGGPILAAYREDHGKTKPFDKMSFPYHLAVYLRLMPDSSGLQFTNRFYEFSNEEVDDLVATGSEITSVKRTQNGVIVSLNIS
jgi:hypothetical protein